MSRQRRAQESTPLPALGGLLSALLASVGGWIVYSAFGIDHNVVLEPAIDAERKLYYSETVGMLNYYVDRHAVGRPLVLLHSINAAASAYEMRPLFDHFRAQRSVYALDLPGFGFSERSDRRYSPQLYARAIIDLLEAEVGQPADVVALSLSSEFVARAALERSDLFNTLAMISPSGFSARQEKRASQQANENGFQDIAYGLLAFPLWSQAFYDLLTTRQSIHYFLQMSFEGPVDAGMEQYDYASAHQPGARYAPLYFVSGKLFTRDIRQTVYENLRLPVLVIYDRDPFVRFDRLDEVVQRHRNWQTRRVAPTKGLPHFERLSETAQALDEFWRSEKVAQLVESAPDSLGWSGKDEG